MNGRRFGRGGMSPMVRELPPQRRQRHADLAAILAGLTLAVGVMIVIGAITLSLAWPL